MKLTRIPLLLLGLALFAWAMGQADLSALEAYLAQVGAAGFVLIVSVYFAGFCAETAAFSKRCVAAPLMGNRI